jgi:hypothetical protein
MTLETGTFCVFNAPNTQRIDERTGFPGVRVSIPPSQAGNRAEIVSFAGDGWVGGRDSAALVRINEGPAEILITIYQREGAAEPPPKIQIQQLSDGTTPEPQPAARLAPSQAELAAAEVAAHIQRRGDVVASIGEWMGERGSQRWIEGFSVAPRSAIARTDIEYQAVLGRGWLSPWSEGGQYCGSRGMALPILGLRARLKGEAAKSHTLRVQATFTDGSAVGPVDGTRTCEAESLAPLEAFLIELVPLPASAEPDEPVERPAPAGRKAARTDFARPAAAPRGPLRGKPLPPRRK